MEACMPYLWIVTTLAMVFFLLGMIIRFSIWLKGQTGSEVLQIRGNPHFWASLGVIFRDGIVHTPLLKRDKFRWLTHLMVLTGFCGLFFLSMLTGFLNILGIAPKSKDTFWLALCNELLGIILLVGLVLVLVRRFLRKKKGTLTNSADWNLWLFLFTITLTGFMTEGLRLLAQKVPVEQAYLSIVGLAFAGLIGRAGRSWPEAYQLFWFVHITISVTFLAYIPYGKMIHGLCAPVLVAWKRIHELEQPSRLPAKPIPEVFADSGRKLNV